MGLAVQPAYVRDGWGSLLNWKHYQDTYGQH